MTAKQPGFVKSINAHEIVIQYDDNTITAYELGRRFGNAAGLIIPHSVISQLKAGEKIQIGDTVCYNEGFFEPDIFNKKRVVFKNSTNVKTVLWESHQTLDDSSALSAKAANKLMTKITKMKTIVIRFDQTVSRLVKLGDELESDDVLCLIEDSITSTNKLFDEQTLDTLKAVGAQAPRAHVKGVVERVEIFYNGEKEDMNEPLLELIKQGSSSSRKIHVGKVDSGFRIENDPLGLDCCAIRVYITTGVPAGVGDKTVYANQMKSVTGGILDQPYVTEDGTEIDSIFGTQSISNRIVSSPFIIGTTTTLLKVIAQKAVKIYKA